ncbi:MAG: bacillithiol biosynthesis cysteine-adding enzyme BshC [Flavobacteriia bacterium]|nr:bacillithiol biosynthesis cysteine-adding enzyme BshC [Flavobacteriia bacterium]
MQKTKINRVETGLFTEISNRLSYHQATLLKYIQAPFSVSAFENQIELKSRNYPIENRVKLLEALRIQYDFVNINDEVNNNLTLLEKESTYTVTTGHQLSVFTGPIYFIYKILHAIKLCKELKLNYPENDFVPVFWMASEDHDFEEIQSVHLFNKTLKWENYQKGAVGRFDFSTFQTLKDDFLELFSKSEYNEIELLIQKYEGKTFGEATFRFIHELFKKYGLIIVDGDHEILKNVFLPTIENELVNSFSYKAISQTNELLEKDSIKQQIHVREINLFYLENNIRERIKLINQQYVIEGIGTFSKEEIIKIAQQNPEKFSPNVALRPLYQETILPNLCYLGGGGEMAYWLQLKAEFEEVNCVFPLIQVRNSLIYIDNASQKKIEKLGLKWNDIVLKTEELKKRFVLNNMNDNLFFNDLESIKLHFSKDLKEIVFKADPSLISYVESEISKFSKQIEGIEQKLIRVEKMKHEQSLNQIDQIKEKLFPNGGFQERKMNFFQICSDGNYSEHLERIYSVISPFENDVIIY